MNKSVPDFLYLKNNFPRISEAKIKEDIHMCERDFEERSNGVEKTAWES